jgi:glycosyltransferase involved in cell wall biosynthesis
MKSGAEEPLKIGIIAHIKHPVREPYAGGLEMHTWNLSEGLRRRGHAVTVFAAEGSQIPGFEPISAATRDIPDFFSAEHHAYFELMRALQERDFDVIHNNSLHYLTIAMAAELPMPVATTLHTPPFWEIEGSARMTASAGHRFVAVSEFLRRIWQPIVPVDYVICNGIDLELFPYCAAPAQEPYLLWSGRIVPEKSLHLAMDAARVAHQPLHIAGPIADRHYFDEYIVPRMENKHARYLGHLSHAALAVEMGGATTFVFTPMWDEPYGLVVAESLSCGTPVAAFDRGAVASVLDPSCGVLVAPGDVGALAVAMGQCATLSRAACRLRATEVADANVMLGRYEALYRQMLREQRLPRHKSGVTLSAAGLAVPSSATLEALYSQHLPGMLCEMPCAP